MPPVEFSLWHSREYLISRIRCAPAAEYREHVHIDCSLQLIPSPEPPAMLACGLVLLAFAARRGRGRFAG